MTTNSLAIQVPPDSTGKRVRVAGHLEIPYSGMSTLVAAGDHCKITRAGALVMHGNCIFVADSAGVGILGLKAHNDFQTPWGGVQAGDDFWRQESGVYVQRATITGAETSYVLNATMQVSGDNPFFAQKVDRYGAAFLRFTEGGVTFDATGRMRQTNNKTLMAVEFHDLLPYHFSLMTGGLGTATPHATQKCVVLSTTGANLDKAGLVSHKHIYHEGNASLFADMSFRVADSGKANVKREWGMFNFERTGGVFFRLNGTSLELVMISNSSGAAVETVVTKANFSEDTLDGSSNSPSGFKLDLTTVNSYWFEIIQDGGGVIKAGVFSEEGLRILAHVFHGNNTTTTGFMTTGSFPFHVMQMDMGGGSTSECFIYACSAEIEGPSARVAGSFFEGCGDPLPVTSLTSWTPLFSIRPALTHLDGDQNYNVILPKLISLDVCDDTDRVTGRRVKIEVFRNATLTGAVWAKRKGDTQTDYYDATTLLGAVSQSGGTAVAEWIVRGNRDLDLGAMYDYANTYLCNNADGTYNTLTVSAKVLDPGVTANIVCAVAWEEVESA